MTSSEAEERFMRAALGDDDSECEWVRNNCDDCYYKCYDDYCFTSIFSLFTVYICLANLLTILSIIDLIDSDNWNDYDYHYDCYVCNQCKQKIITPYWCQPCNSSRFKKEFDSWESGNDIIDAFIRDVQLKATSSFKTLEWIPYSKFKDITYLAEGGFGKVYSAEWPEGYILYWNTIDSQWKRNGTTNVALKCLNNSQNIIELLDEIQNLYNCNDETSFITRCYGITQHDETNDLMIVMQLMKDDSLRKNLSKLQEMSWKDKFVCLSRIAEGLSQMHSVELVHRDFHTGNILLSSIGNNTPYITDLGICKPFKKSAENRRVVYGVLPYVAPEVLRGEEYTKAADVYAFGVIMCEVISGTLPFKDVPHDRTLSLRILGDEKLRPKVPENTPALVTELMQKCWDDNPQNRLSSHEIRNILRAWSTYYDDTELAKQIEESENMVPGSVDDDEIHPGTFYKSRCLTDELKLLNL